MTSMCGHAWLCGLWPGTWHSFNIAVLELYPIRVAAYIWGSARANENVCFSRITKPSFPSLTNRLHESYVFTASSGSLLACLRFNINCAVRHVRGWLNILADKLYCSQTAQFHKLASWVSEALRMFHTVHPQPA